MHLYHWDQKVTPPLLRYPGAADVAIGVYFTALPLIMSTGTLKTEINGNVMATVRVIRYPVLKEKWTANLVLNTDQLC